MKADGGATHYFENLDELENWEPAHVGAPMQSNGFEFNFTVYKNKNPLKFTNA